METINLVMIILVFLFLSIWLLLPLIDEQLYGKSLGDQFRDGSLFVFLAWPEAGTPVQRFAGSVIGRTIVLLLISVLMIGFKILAIAKLSFP